ncbi:topoisomerase C-terminal repeat-containing protein [Paraburkholderia strydomiana]|uniref:topoisomerase C-terminal repeat-containing protein n=1 Tax=Paraburkholderia strydomiana TaxID=1245417 RepID=UPI0038B73614
MPDDVAETPTDELAVVHLKAPCPKCGGAVVVGDRAYESECGWRVWRNILTHDISQAEMEEILRDGESRVIDDFESPKSGKEFSARLKLAASAAADAEADEDAPKRTLELVFVDRPVQSVGSCPKCKSNVVLRAGNYFCEQNTRKGADGEAVTPKCDFVLWGEVSGKSLPEGAVKDLLAGKQTKMLKGFKSRSSGKAFDAALKLTPAGKIDFVFQEKTKKKA